MTITTNSCLGKAESAIAVLPSAEADYIEWRWSSHACLSRGTISDPLRDVDNPTCSQCLASGYRPVCIYVDEACLASGFRGI
jgi:hypothetical protein